MQIKMWSCLTKCGIKQIVDLRAINPYLHSRSKSWKAYGSPFWNPRTGQILKAGENASKEASNIKGVLPCFDHPCRPWPGETDGTTKKETELVGWGKKRERRKEKWGKQRRECYSSLKHGNGNESQEQESSELGHRHGNKKEVEMGNGKWEMGNGGFGFWWCGVVCWV